MKNLDILVGQLDGDFVFHLTTNQGRTALSAVTDLIPVEAYGYTSEIFTVSVPPAIGHVIFDIIDRFDNVTIGFDPRPYTTVLQRARIIAGLEQEPDPFEAVFDALAPLFKALFGPHGPRF